MNTSKPLFRALALGALPALGRSCTPQGAGEG